MPSVGSAGSFGTLLSGPMCPVTDNMTHWERIDREGGGGGGDRYDIHVITWREIVRSGVI